jgi:5-methylcytosine-specific restriction protein A
VNRRNPPWVRDELMLALDLYMRYDPSRISKKHRELIALSKTLKKLPLHKRIPDRKTFRSPSSIYMQLRTFMSLDPRTRAAGLTHANKLEKKIWKEFSRDLETLNRIAVAIRALAKSSVIKLLKTSVEEESSCPAGKLLYRFHKKLEANRKLNERKKKQSRSLKCELCGFDFEKTYGPVGKGYIELHHKVPLSQLSHSRKARLADLMLICSNCHSIIHRQLGFLRRNFTIR